jgi:hypothetical protein
MDPVSLDAAVLKLRFPELILRPGMQVVARVASRGEGLRAAIVLGNNLISATVPEHVLKGDTLRLTVAETSAERVVLRLDGATPLIADANALIPQATPPPIPPRQDLDQGGERASRGRGGERPTVALTYETPALGRLDLRLEQGPEGVVVVVGAPRGTAPLALKHAEELRAALQERTPGTATVRVEPHREPLDTYA